MRLTLLFKNKFFFCNSSSSHFHLKHSNSRVKKTEKKSTLTTSHNIEKKNKTCKLNIDREKPETVKNYFPITSQYTAEEKKNFNSVPFFFLISFSFRHRLDICGWTETCEKNSPWRRIFSTVEQKKLAYLLVIVDFMWFSLIN